MKNKKRWSARNIAMMGMLMAMQLILTRFLAIETPFVRISFLFVPTVIMGMLFGPFLTATGSALTDFFGVMLFPKTGSYFPGFTLSAVLTGLIYGYFFYRKEMTLTRVILANALVTVLISIGLNTLWLYMIMGPGVLAELPLRIGKDLILLPIQIMITYAVGNQSLIKKQRLKFQ